MRRSRAGFTVVDISLALAILSLLAVQSIPNQVALQLRTHRAGLPSEQRADEAAERAAAEIAASSRWTSGPIVGADGVPFIRIDVGTYDPNCALLPELCPSLTELAGAGEAVLVQTAAVVGSVLTDPTTPAATEAATDTIRAAAVDFAAWAPDTETTADALALLDGAAPIDVTDVAALTVAVADDMTAGFAASATDSVNSAMVGQVDLMGAVEDAIALVEMAEAGAAAEAEMAAAAEECGYDAWGNAGCGLGYEYDADQCGYDAWGWYSCSEEERYGAEECGMSSYGWYGCGPGYEYDWSECAYAASGSWGCGPDFVYAWSECGYDVSGIWGCGPGHTYGPYGAGAGL